ncbi:MAG: DinB family protein [Bacteroidia bacterium]
MKETERISKLMGDSYNGNPWIEVTLLGTLKTISAKQAAKKIAPHWNSIWEIVNHIISWRLNLLQRVQGKVINTPADNYFTAITDTSEIAWQDTLKRLEDSQQQWISFLEEFNEEEFEKVYPKNNLTYYEHIHAIISHDAYHLGQIVLLAKGI